MENRLGDVLALGEHSAMARLAIFVVILAIAIGAYQASRLQNQQALWSRWYGKDDIKFDNRQLGDGAWVCQGVHATARSPQQLQKLVVIGGVTRIKLSGLAFQDEHLAVLESFPRLESLWLDATSIRSLRFLVAAPRLQEFGVEGQDISTAGLAALINAPRLESLCLAKTSVNEHVLYHLRMPERLRSLNLSYTRFPVEQLSRLAQCRSLRCLRLSGLDLSIAEFAWLRSLPELWLLDLDDTALTDAGLAEILSVTQLGVLSINRTCITDDSAPCIVESCSLRVVYATETGMTAASEFYLSRGYVYYYDGLCVYSDLW